MSQTDLISVVMPVFNGEKYLKQAIQSILNQSYTHFEFIIINDGSTDTTKGILDELIDKRIKCVHFESNQGLIAALNHGFSIATGRFIARMDADDVALPQRLQLQIEAMQQHPEWIACDTDYYWWDGQSKKPSLANFNSDELKLLLIFTTCFCHPTVMIRNDISSITLQYESDFKHVEDYRLWTQLAVHGELGHITVPLLLYRHHPSQVSNMQRSQQLQGSKRIRQDYLVGMGIQFDEATWQSLHQVGSNEFIRDMQQLLAIENSLNALRASLLSHTNILPSAITSVIQKFWFDSCGYTNLGLKAFISYNRSSLSKGNRTLVKQIRLLLKCLLRVGK